MKETLFVQFYSKIEDTNPRFKGHSLYELCNGFSDTYDLCRDKGDFVWINHSKQLKGYGHSIDDHIDVDFPINKGTAYISAYYLSQLYQAYLWALKYPNIEFIVGGPASNPQTYEVDETIFPSNLKIIYQSVEEYFGVPNFSYPWKLVFPDAKENFTLTYSYILSSTCYWGKCIFCNYKYQGKRDRPKINFEFRDVKYNGKQRIHLYSPAMTATQLNEVLYQLDHEDNIRYDFYLRCNKSERDTLEQIFKDKRYNFPQSKFIVGVEFPSERMLKYMNKNITVDGILKTIEVISNYGDEDIQIQLPFILGWDNLTDNDLESLESFLNKLPYDKVKFSFSVNLLTAKPCTYVYENYKRGKELYIGPFLYGFMPLIDDEQINLSKQAVNIMDTKGVTVFDYCDIRGM